ncbi:MAG: hypothetical protein M3290_00310 [Actinomycetota bacterium]|nr:hypothetical protein [Actinomycetota bacterium]
MEADIHGAQRKTLDSSVRPLNPNDGTMGIPLRNGSALPFVVSRTWSAPAGYYDERWFLIDPSSREVLYEGPLRTEAHIWGLQSLTELRDEIRSPFPLEPGSYHIVFWLGGALSGETEVVAAETADEGAGRAA